MYIHNTYLQYTLSIAQSTSKPDEIWTFYTVRTKVGTCSSLSSFKELLLVMIYQSEVSFKSIWQKRQATLMHSELEILKKCNKLFNSYRSSKIIRHCQALVSVSVSWKYTGSNHDDVLDSIVPFFSYDYSTISFWVFFYRDIWIACSKLKKIFYNNNIRWLDQVCLMTQHLIFQYSLY